MILRGFFKEMHSLFVDTTNQLTFGLLTDKWGWVDYFHSPELRTSAVKVHALIFDLLKKHDLAWLVPIPKHQSWELEDLTKACPEISSHLHKADCVEQVLETLRLKDKWPIPCPVLTGSLYLVGDMLQRLRAKTQ